MSGSVDTPAVLDFGTDIDRAATALERIWAPDEENAPSAEEPKQEQAEAPSKAEAQQAKTEDETPETKAGEAEEDGAEEEAEDDADEAEKKPLDPATPVTVKVDGKDETVPLSEAIAGYQRQSDYTRKTQQLAEERRALHSEVQQVRTERTQYAQMLQALGQQLQQAAPKEPDWERLKAEDPIEYAIKREEWRDYRDRQQAIAYEQQRLAQIRAVEEQQELASQVSKEHNLLVEKVPEFRDEKSWVKAQQQLREYGQKLGYSPEELSQAYDHRAVLALYKAMKYDQLMAAKPTPKPAPTPGVSGPKPLKAGSAAAAPRTVTEVTRAKQRLAQTGSLQDAAAVFEKLL